MFDTRSRFADKDDARNSSARRSENDGEYPKAQGTENSMDWDDDRATLVNSDGELACLIDRSTYWDSDSDSGTDDGVDAGLDETGSLLWRHITFIIAPNRIFGEPNVLFAKVTITHTKGEDNRPREQVSPSYLCISDAVADLLWNRKTFIVEREDNPLLCLLDHLLSMALYDDVFAAEPLRNVNNIFRAEVPAGKKCLQLKMKRAVLDTPVFREPGRAVDGHRTSPTKPLRSGTWLRYLRRLGRNSGLEQSFTQYCARRGLVNAVNSKLVLLPLRSSSRASMLIHGILADQAPSSVRDQIFDHQSNAVRYYLDREVRFNTQAAFLGRPSDDVVQKLARLMTLTVDLNAPNKLSEELSKKLGNSKRVIQLSHESKALTKKLKHKYRFLRLAPPNDPWLQAKKQVDITLHREKTNRRNRMLEKARRRHFRNADTATLEAQFANESFAAFDKNVKPSAPLSYDISERGEIVRLTCEPIADLTGHEKHARRVKTLRARVALCGRQESRRRRPQSTQSLQEPMTPPKTSSEDSKEDKHDRFPLVCKPTQCIFCLGNERKSYQGRTAEYARPNKMMNEVERHLKRFASDDPIPCPHPRCTVSELVLPHLMAFKNHTAMVHKIMLRA